MISANNYQSHHSRLSVLYSQASKYLSQKQYTNRTFNIFQIVMHLKTQHLTADECGVETQSITANDY